MTKSGKDNHEWQELRREKVFQQYSRKIERVDFRLPDGSEADFYIKAEGPAVSILGLTKDKQVILVREYRPGPKRMLDELPGGFVDAGETPLAAAQREFLEETGYTGNFQDVGVCLDDAYSTMERHCFVATTCKKITEPQHSATEHTEVMVLPLQKFRKLLQSGQMTDVEVAYLGLDYLKLL